MRRMGLSRATPPADLRAACAAEAVLLLRGRAYFADRVDWPTTIQAVQRAIAEGAELAAALHLAFRALGDRHSFLRPAGAGCTQPVTASKPVGRQLAAEIGYLRLPGFPGGSRSPLKIDYVHAAWTLLRELRASTGWVLDLRGNGGGSIVPMLAAAGPLLGTGSWLSYQRRDGSLLAYQYAAGELFANDKRLLAAPGPPADASQLAVAVLSDGTTASAAEGVRVAFRGRARTRSLGTSTAGVPTGNAGFRLGDGSLLLIATSVAVDRFGRTYADALSPDQAGGIAAARSWLHSLRPSPFR